MALRPVKSGLATLCFLFLFATYMPFVASVTTKIQFLALPAFPFNNVVEKLCLPNNSINIGGKLPLADEGGEGLKNVEG